MSTTSSLLTRLWPLRAGTSSAQVPPRVATDAVTALPSPAVTPAPWARVLCSAVHCAAADDAAGLLHAAREGRPLPQVDSTLSHADGLPVMALRLPHLPLLAWNQAWAQARTALPTDHPLHAATPLRVQRALAALQQPLQQALQQAWPWLQPLPTPSGTVPRNDFGLQRVQAAPAHQSPRTPGLRALAAWPATWSDAERRWATGWLQLQLGPEANCQATATNASHLLRQAHQHRAEADRRGEPDLLLLLACHSDLDDDTVLQLGQAGVLFQAGSCPHGRVASEAAAALLLSPVDLPAPSDVDTLPAACLLSLASAVPPAMPEPPDADRLVQGTEAAPPTPWDEAGLTDACRRALADAAVKPEALEALVADAGHHGPAVHALCASSAALSLPADPRHNVHLTAPVAGQGPTSGLLVLAAAAARCEEAQAPCLAVMLGHPPLQLAAVVAPAHNPDA